MRSPSGLTQVLRSAVLQALAAGACVSPLVACGGAVQALPGDDGGDTPDALTEDSAPPRDAGRDARDSGEPPDADAAVDAPDDVVVPDDSGCVPIGQMSFCTSVPYTCVPPGLDAGYNQAPACTFPCGSQNFGCGVEIADAGPDAGEVLITCFCGGGRFPAGLALVAGRAAAGSDPVGAVLACNAALEGAAVHAFERLAQELAAHGAPADLAARARRAARQEVRHERMLRRAAEARGCAVPATRQDASTGLRSLGEIARENAVEGCGREALGAALLELQSRRCTDASLRPILARIAADELGHAQLSWELHAWLLPRLSDAERAEVLAAHEAFLDGCAEGLPPELADPRVAGALGVPTAPEWRALVHAVRWGLRDLGSALLAA